MIFILVLFLARKVSLPREVLYIVAQCLGDTVGVALIMGTFFLVYIVFSATDPKGNARNSHIPILAPLPTGFVVFMVHLATIPITETGINPARSFGAAVVYNEKEGMGRHGMGIFWFGPFVGAAFAAMYLQFVLRGGAARAYSSIRSHTINV
ncbi:hypothetical protein MKX03_036115 [Papaver bracteatum]|nr:hypothetical protein MKX03_036115 [Papaver bracteatum]